MTVRRRRFVDRAFKIERFDDACRCTVEDFFYGFRNFFDRRFFRAESFDHNRHGKGNADRIREFDFGSVGETCGDDVFCDITCHIGCRPVDFRRIFAAERAAAVTTHAAVSVYDDFAPGQPRIPLGTAGDETPRRIDKILRVFVEQARRLEHGFYDPLDYRLFDFAVFDGRIVLMRDDDGVDPQGNVSFVFDRHLAFRVGAQPGDRLVFAEFGRF